jgi:pimeloyl-ACP methyl ester carboxylesterase
VVRTEAFEVDARGGVRLQGTLTIPADGELVPAALLLNGSGPLDRDSNMPGQALNVASGLASALASRGVGSLRFDKRGVGRSSGDYLTTGFEQETDDAGAALAALRLAEGVDGSRVTVIGHSVGATIAMRLARESPWVVGAVLLSASVRSGAEVMRWQSERIAASLRWPFRLFAGSFVRRQARVRQRLGDSTGDVVRIGRTDLPARWFREYMRHDPTADLRAIRCPVLALTGRNDVQVDPDDVARIGELVGGDFSGDTPDAVTHLLRRHVGRAGLGGYRAQLDMPPDAELLDRVAAWTKAR